MKKKKWLSLCIGTSILMGMLTACGSGDTAAKPQETQAQQTETPQTAADTAEASGTTDFGGAEISVWIPPYASSDAEQNDQEFWDAQFDAFEAENNCTVHVEVVPWDGYIQKITTGLTSGDGPDVLYIDTPYDLAAAGALEPLEPYFTEEEAANYIYWDLGKINGTQYLAPMLVGNASILYCNMDILNQAGIEAVPQTWEEFMDACVTIKETTGIQPFLQSWGGTVVKGVITTSFLPYYWQSGGEFLDSEGKPAINNEYGLKTLEFLKSFMDNGIYDETITAEDDIKTKFQSGELAMYVGDTGSASRHTEKGINWDFTPALTGTDGVQATWIAADSLAVAANSENKEVAVAAMKYMLSAPVMDAFHEQMYAMCPVTTDAAYFDNEKFQTMYTEQADIFRNWPQFENADSFWDILFKNIQSMYMGDMTPQEVLDDTMEQYEAQIV